MFRDYLLDLLFNLKKYFILFLFLFNILIFFFIYLFLISNYNISRFQKIIII